MFFRIEPYIALLLMLATTAFAGLKGGPPERWGTAMIVVAWVGTIVAQVSTHEVISIIRYLLFDGLLAVGFLVVAVRYSSLWLGAAMICQAISFGVHAMRLSDDAPIFWRGMNVYILIINVVSYLVLAILAGGTFATMIRRRRADREKVEDRSRIIKRPDWLLDTPPPTADAL